MLKYDLEQEPYNLHPSGSGVKSQIEQGLKSLNSSESIYNAAQFPIAVT